MGAGPRTWGILGGFQDTYNQISGAKPPIFPFVSSRIPPRFPRTWIPPSNSFALLVKMRPMIRHVLTCKDLPKQQTDCRLARGSHRQSTNIYSGAAHASCKNVAKMRDYKESGGTPLRPLALFGPRCLIFEGPDALQRPLGPASGCAYSVK